jgi:hypothetical protein
MVRPPRKRRARKGAEARDADPYVLEAEQFAEEFVALATERFDEHELDLTIDSIRGLDRICRFSREAFDDGLVLKAGFYFGEMLRRAFAGKYRWLAARGALAVDIEGLTVLPIEVVRRLVSGKATTTLQEFLLILAKRISEQRARGSTPPAPGSSPATDPDAPEDAPPIT